MLVRMLNGPRVNLNYSYKNDMGISARVFMTPYTNGNPSPGYTSTGTQLHGVGTGNDSGYFTISTGNVTVDQLRFLVTNSDQSLLIAEYFIPVHYVFGNATVPVANIEDVVSSIDVFPNPTVEDATLNVLIKEDQAVRVSVLDITGRLVLDLGSRELSAQSLEQWEIPTGTLHNGTYLILAEGAGFKVVKKLVVVKWF